MAKVGIFNQPYKAKLPTVEGPKGASGDYYGTGIKQKVGRMRGDSVGYRPVNPKQMGTPPTSLS